MCSKRRENRRRINLWIFWEAKLCVEKHNHSYCFILSASARARSLAGQNLFRRIVRQDCLWSLQELSDSRSAARRRRLRPVSWANLRLVHWRSSGGFRPTGSLGFERRCLMGKILAHARAFWRGRKSCTGAREWNKQETDVA